MERNRHLTILGAGPAGLAVGYYARKHQLPFTIYEASDRVGGNCITLRHGEFLFDSGAHRLHDKFEDITNEIKNLLGEDLQKIDSPSQIYHRRKFIDFPLSPLNLLSNLGFFSCAKAAFGLIRSRLMQEKKDASFESFAVHTYGRNLAERFLLGYSEKLWGATCKKLSPSISGSRMKGLGLKTFLIEAIFGRQVKTEHLDGSFYYPKMGYGTISEELAEFCGRQNIQKNARVTKIFHVQGQMKAVEINGNERINVEALVNTLPLNLFLSMLNPAVREEIDSLSKSLRFRNLILVALFIDRPQITPNASIYFPDPEYPFTRIYEPKNRSVHMSPPGKTSLVVEIPCDLQDEHWKSEDNKLIELVAPQLCKVFSIASSEILDTRVVRIYHAYPILELGFEEKIEQLVAYLNGFENLKLSGRSGMFTYSHLHDMMRFGKELIEECLPLSGKKLES